jgi:hypothetical protein
MNLLWHQRPAKEADPMEWVEFHRRGARLYAQAARNDPRHRHEASQCAGLEIRRARDIEHRINPDLDEDDS